MPYQGREPFQRQRHLALGRGLEPGRDGAVEVVAVMESPLPARGEPAAPKRGNALGLPLADWKCSQAERGSQ